MNPRLAQFLGIIFIVVCGAMTILVYQSTMMIEGQDVLMLITSGMIAWAILALPEMVIVLVTVPVIVLAYQEDSGK